MLEQGKPGENVLQIRDLEVEFKTDTGITNALTGVSFDVRHGDVTAIVWESGSGKSVTANCIMRIIQPPGKIVGGSIEFDPSDQAAFDVVQLNAKDQRLYDLRGGHISMVFQEPMTALSPVYTVGNQVAEAILCHRDVSEEVAWREAAEMLELVGITDIERRMRMYPFEFLGGMRQRVIIAMALVCNPEVLICDEPTTALDVTIQAEILTLIRELQQRLNNSVIFITHDLGVVAQLADHVVVMYQGRVLEIELRTSGVERTRTSLYQRFARSDPRPCKKRRAARVDCHRCGRRRYHDTTPAADPKRRSPSQPAQG
tara:strand:+ start:302 stop:1246 length:945 start_codon:yes stop_codon:yes gene_type:complete